MLATSRSCDQVIDEISNALQHDHAAVLSSAVYQHISACSRCRAGLLLLVRAFDPAPEHRAHEQTCAACQADLAAFIDLEAEAPVQAAELYPHVWWHLWRCETCAQTYEFTQTLRQAYHSGLLRPFRISRQAVPKALPVLKKMRISRPQLMFVLPETARVASTRSTDHRFVVFEDGDNEPEQRQFTVTVDEQRSDAWQVTITLHPPIPGLVVLALGSFRRVVPFNAEGTAVVHDVPAELLRHADGPALEIEVLASES